MDCLFFRVSPFSSLHALIARLMFDAIDEEKLRLLHVTHSKVTHRWFPWVWHGDLVSAGDQAGEEAEVVWAHPNGSLHVLAAVAM